MAPMVPHIGGQRRVPKGIAGVQLGIQGLQGPMAPLPLTSGFILVSFTGKFADILGSIG